MENLIKGALSAKFQTVHVAPLGSPESVCAMGAALQSQLCSTNANVWDQEKHISKLSRLERTVGVRAAADSDCIPMFDRHTFLPQSKSASCTSSDPSTGFYVE
eukprot:gene22916-9307_t